VVASLRQLGSASTRRLAGFGSTNKKKKQAFEYGLYCNLEKRKVASALKKFTCRQRPLALRGRKRWYLHFCTSTHDLHIGNQWDVHFKSPQSPPRRRGADPIARYDDSYSWSRMQIVASTNRGLIDKPLKTVSPEDTIRTKTFQPPEVTMGSMWDLNAN
jgi:hypothetical protein